jgi:hypothetical protein
MARSGRTVRLRYQLADSASARRPDKKLRAAT